MDKIDYFSLLALAANHTSNLLITLSYKKKRRWKKRVKNTIFSWNSKGSDQKILKKSCFTCGVVKGIFGALMRRGTHQVLITMLLLFSLLLLVVFYFYY